MLSEALSGWMNTKHNNPFDFWVMFIVLNCVWIVVPAFATLVVGFRIQDSVAKARRY
jgi:hypothetical protein